MNDMEIKTYKSKVYVEEEQLEDKDAVIEMLAKRILTKVVQDGVIKMTITNHEDKGLFSIGSELQVVMPEVEENEETAAED